MKCILRYYPFILLLVSLFAWQAESLFAQVDGNWVKQSPSPTGETIEDVFFVDENTGWAVGLEGEIVFTKDGGSTWSTQSSGTTSRLRNVFFLDESTGWVVGDTGTILHTTDGGANWVAQNSASTNSLSDICFVDASNGWAVGRDGKILHTSDGGSNWKSQNSGTTWTLASVSFSDTKNGWAVGSGSTIVHTSDGGENWLPQNSGVTGFLSGVYFLDANKGWAAGAAGRILQTIDGGDNWASQNSAITSSLSDIYFVDASNGWAVGRFGRIVHTSDGGNNWEFQESSSNKDLQAVYFANASIGWAVGLDGTIVHTKDGGLNWEAQNSGTFERYNGVSFSDASTGWVVGQNGTIVHTSDGGENWLPQNSGTDENLNDVSFTDASTGWAVGDGGMILHTSDGGDNWVAQNSGTINRLDGIVFTGETTGWAVGQSGTIVYTSDGGDNWESQNSNTIYWLFGLHFINASTGWAVGDRGTIIHTSDGGNTWAAQSSNTTSELMDVSFSDVSTGWAVGWDGTIVHTNDGGENWNNQSNDSTNRLYGVSFANESTGWAVGISGTILHTSDGGTNWVEQNSGTNNWLWGVHFTDAGTGWAVGEEGSIIHFEGPDAPEKIVLSSPADKATDVALQPTFEWSSDDGTESYELVLSVNSDFSYPLVDESDITATHFEIPLDLNHGQTYFWQVRGVNTDVRGPWSDGFSFTTIPELPEQVVLSSPANESEDIELQPILEWSEADGAESYELILSFNADFSEPVISESNLTSTSFKIESGLDREQNYYWQVRGVNSGGNGNWSEGFSFTTIPDKPGQVVLSTPSDESRDVELQPILEWSAADRAETYDLVLSVNVDFSNPLISESALSDKNFEIAYDLDRDQMYYWQVRGVNAGNAGPWSDGFSFTTIPEQPNTVVLIAPEDGATCVATDSSLTWLGSERAEQYRIQIAELESFESTTLDSTLADSSLSAGDLLDFDSTYYWRVKALTAGGESEWSESRSFSTLPDLPGMVEMMLPEDGAKDVEINPILSWQKSKNAKSYRIQLSMAPKFNQNDLVADADGIVNTELLLTEDLESSAEYFWRVRSENEAGISEWSDPFSFTTVMATSVENMQSIPVEFSLAQNYPNPFNPTTVIEFGLPEPAPVRLEVFNMIGQSVALLVNEQKTAGWHTVTLDASSLSSGAYLYHIQAGEFNLTRKLTLIK